MTDRYISPLSTRYASTEMQYLFSDDFKFKTWRKLWVALAKAEKELGLQITQQQIDELVQYQDDINFDVAKEREQQVRHDVMSHVYAYGQQAVDAAGIIHLGATSCYVGDNTDLIVMKKALELTRKKLVSIIALLAGFAEEYKNLPTLGFTHLQPAQLTTVGKRATLWISDLLSDLGDLEYRHSHLRFLGSKGATGTQASFVDLFGREPEKIRQLDRMIADAFEFDEVVPVAGQTYSRKTDFQVLSVLSGIAQSATKFATDLRLLQSMKEIEEPFEKSQIGSSAMPYKRNPMRCERICGLARYVIADLMNPAMTAASQWLERTLDDSANKRISVPEAFLATDAVLNLMLNVCDGLVVYPKVIAQHVQNELPFMASERILMEAVKAGGDRQELHERLRVHSQEAARMVKEDGKPNDLIERICGDPAFHLDQKSLLETLKPENFIGLADVQTEQFLKDYVEPVLLANSNFVGEKGILTV